MRRQRNVEELVPREAGDEEAGDEEAGDEEADDEEAMCEAGEDARKGWGVRRS